MCIPHSLYGKTLKFSWKSQEHLHYNTIRVYNEEVVIDDSEVFVFHYEAETWDNNQSNCFRCYVNDDIMVCLSVPRSDQEACQGSNISGYFKLKEFAPDGSYEWHRQPFDFVLSLEPLKSKSPSPKHAQDTQRLHHSLKETELSLNDEEERLLQELQRIRERKVRVRRDIVTQSLSA